MAAPCRQKHDHEENATSARIPGLSSCHRPFSTSDRAREITGPVLIRSASPIAPSKRWRHFGFLTDLDGDVAEVDQSHRDHATVELAIRDLEEGEGMDHVPSGDFSANSAWPQCAVLAHNLIRWTATLGQPGLWTASP